MSFDNDGISLIKISSIKIENPRTRNKFRHDEITDSIDKSGLRKPITVRRIDDKQYEYALICGQGRLESISNLNEETIPAFIMDIEEDDAYIMSLVENFARINPRSGEQFHRIKEMKTEGHSEKEIAKTLGCTVSWINSISTLLDKGETKLLSIVESGKIPLYLAVQIARSDFHDSQRLIVDAFDEGKIKGRNITKIRDILDSRNEGLKGVFNRAFRTSKSQKKLTTDELTKLYQDNIDEHRSLKNKADFIEENIILARQIMNELMKNEEFLKILESEKLTNIPQAIIERKN